MNTKQGVIFSICALLFLTGLIITFTSNKKIKNVDESRPLIIEKLDSVPIDTYGQLQDLGFTNSKNLKLGDNYDNTVNPNKVLFYQKKYGLKYISKNGMNNLLKLYDLIEGNTNDFTDKIPDTNVKDLLAKLKFLKEAKLFSNFYVNGDVHEDGPVLDYVDENNVKPGGKEKAMNQARGSDPLWIANWVYKDIYNSNDKYGHIPLILHYTKEPKLKVIGPKESFSLTKNEIIQDGHITKIDPMIVFEIDNGYLVLTKWLEKT